MNIQIHSVDFDPSEALNELIQKRLQSTFGRFEFIHRTDVYLRVEPKDKVRQHQMEMKLNVPQNELFVKAAEDRFEKALDVCISKMKPQVKRVKDKLNSY